VLFYFEEYSFSICAIIKVGGGKVIEHIYIRNYKAFKKENIPLDKHTLLIGTNNSGKTSVLEALDLFFNEVLLRDFIQNKQKDVIVEIHINNKRYRKVFSPPSYHLNFQKCIGNMFELHSFRYLYLEKNIDNAKLMNDILSINLIKKISPEEQRHILKVFDYIDGSLQNNNYLIFEHKTNVKMNINNHLEFTKEDYSKIISNITHQYLVLGIDNVETNFDLKTIHNITKYTYQTIYSTNDKSFVKRPDYYISALYKGNLDDDFDTIKKRLENNQNHVYILVEGKYDVNWFETALRLLNLEKRYIVIPCGGYGNISFVQSQLQKEGYKTIVFTDGDVGGNNALSKEVIELYADKDYVNRTFGTHFKRMPSKKHVFFGTIKTKDEVVKNILSRWAKKHLTKNNAFVIEVAKQLKKFDPDILN
jgi:predicted ATP-dependent endonuclease of OLD family